MSSFWLEIAQQGQTQQFSFDSGRVSIGRDKASDFIIDHPTVSRQHGMITFDNQGFRLVVLSRGGMTAVDGQQVQGEVPLYDGTQVHFGSQCFTFRSQNAPPAPYPQQQQQQWNQGGNATSGSWDALPAPGNGTSGSWDAQPAPGNAPSGSWDAQPAPGNGTSGGWEAQGPSNDGWNPGWDDQAGGGDGWQSPQEKQSAADSDFMTWGDIAAKAEPVEQKKSKQEAPKKPKKTSPMLVIALLGAVGLMGYAFVKPMLTDKGPVAVEEKINPTGVIELEVDCVGEASCRGDAINAFKVGQAAAEKVQADITNLYEAHYQFTRATALLEKGGIAELPAELAEMEDLHRPVKKELAKLFQQERVKYLDAKKKKDTHRMKAAVKTVMAYVPDSACDYNKWAQQEKDWMKDKNAWPADVDDFGNPM